MDFNEKELKKIVRKSNYKRTGINVLVSISSLIVLLILIFVPLLSYYNYISFGDKYSPKVKGLPDNSLRALSSSDGYMGLLLDYSGGYEFNSKVKEMNIYMDYYEKGERKKHEIIASVEADNDTVQVNGTFFWGILEDESKLKTTINYTNGAQSNGSYDISDMATSNWTGSTYMIPGDTKKTNSDKVLLVKFVKNKNDTISSFTDGSDPSKEFSPAVIKQSDKLLQIYAEFK